LPKLDSQSAGGFVTSHPKTIFIIRHAEKPNDAGDPHLSERGRRRAAALPGYPFPELAAIFAATATSESARPVETITPLAAARKLEVSAEVKVATLVTQVLTKDFEGTSSSAGIMRKSRS
jgi:broad specificity phosphatase PhoE